MKEYHFWLSAKDETGKPYLVYACADREGENQARQRGMELLPGLDFSIHRWPTRDIDSARGYLAGKRLDSTHNLREAGRRQGHEKSIARLKRRAQRRI